LINLKLITLVFITKLKHWQILLQLNEEFMKNKKIFYFPETSLIIEMHHRF